MTIASIYRAIGIIILHLALLGCNREKPEHYLLFDFESDADLDRLVWTCKTQLALSEHHVTHGKKSLRMDLYPSEYPGLISRRLDMRNWEGFTQLSFDVFNESEKTVRLGVRIDDRDDFPQFDDRYNKSFFLPPGLSTIVLPLDSLTTPHRERRLNLRTISRFYFFVSHPTSRLVLYIDAVVLSRNTSL